GRDGAAPAPAYTLAGAATAARADLRCRLPRHDGRTLPAEPAAPDGRARARPRGRRPGVLHGAPDRRLAAAAHARVRAHGGGRPGVRLPRAERNVPPGRTL